jgi:uncharacterized membrane protein YkgB
MREPSVGKENLGAVIGAVIGAVGGLVAIAIPYAVMTHNIQNLSAARSIGLISFLVCTPIGWFAGGYLSHFLEKFLATKTASIVGGIIGGLLPVTGVALYGWHMATQ